MQVAVGAEKRLDVAAPTMLFKTEISTVLNPYRMDYVPAAANVRNGSRDLRRVARPFNDESALRPLRVAEVGR